MSGSIAWSDNENLLYKLLVMNLDSVIQLILDLLVENDHIQNQGWANGIS